MDETARVLLVTREDTAEATREELTARAAVEPVVEPNPHAALDRIAEADCVVVSDGLDGTSSVALVERVRDLAPELPVVLFPAAGDESLASRAIGAGVADYVAQSEGYDALAAAVERACEGRREPANGEQSTAGERTMAVLEDATAEILRANSREDVCEVGVRAAERVLGLPSIGIHLRDDDGAFPPVAVSDVTHERFDGEVPPLPPDGVVADIFETGGPRRIADDLVEETTIQREAVVVPLGRHGVLVAAPPAADPYVDEPSEVATVLGQIVETALDRVEHERRLERLHETTRELMRAETEVAVAEVAVETARDVLGLDISSIHLLEGDDGDTESDRGLTPVAVSEKAREMIGEPPTFEPGDSIAWQVFETGQPAVYADVRESSSAHNPGTEIRSELFVPLGDHGMFLAGSRTVGAFDDSTVALAKLFGANVERALERATREQALRERECELERNNERLEEFASVVSHDLRTPLSIAAGRLDLVAQDCDSEHLPAIRRAHERMEELIEDLLTLAREGRRVGDRRPVDLADLARSVWEPLDGGALELDDPGTVEADEGRLRELFENLLGNAVEHGDSGVTVEVGRTDDGGFYVADDGPGLPDDDPDRLFEYGYTDAEDGTGLGLAIVRRIAEAHGWTVSATDAEGGGARFETRPAPGEVDRCVEGGHAADDRARSDCGGAGSVGDESESGDGAGSERDAERDDAAEDLPTE